MIYIYIFLCVYICTRFGTKLGKRHVVLLGSQSLGQRKSMKKSNEWEDRRLHAMDLGMHECDQVLTSSFF